MGPLIGKKVEKHHLVKKLKLKIPPKRSKTPKPKGKIKPLKEPME